MPRLAALPPPPLLLTMLALAAPRGAQALPNGEGELPEMGVNTWYAFHENLVNYTWRANYTLSEDVLAHQAALVQLGLLELGYTRLNFDDCIVIGRDATTHELIADPAAFPDGPLAVSRKLAAMGFSMGWYTVRGDTTCASGPPPRIERPGSHGFEALDAQTYAQWGVAYLKDDTCGAPEVPYPVMGSALNASGAHIFFSLCEPGAGPVNSPIGRSMGNGWRIDEDDGGLWRPILDNVNMNAPLFANVGCDEQHNFDGHGCGWNDMGLLMVGGGMTHDEDRSHLALWAIMATKLLISVDVRKMAPEAIALISNPEVIAIDQDALKLQGQRVVPPVNASRSAEDRLRIARWKREHLAGGSWRAAGRSHELLVGGGHEAGAVPGTEEDEVLAAGGRPEVWQRRLVGGAWALLLFNNGMAAQQPVACDAACVALMGFGAGASVRVRDVFARTDNGTFAAADGYSALVPPNGTVLVRLTAA
jgi:alpha-galactosidase